MPKQFYKLNDFSGGLNKLRDARDIAPNELVQADNIELDTVGKIKTSTDTRGGSASVVTQGKGYPGGGLFYFESDREGSANAKDTGESWTIDVDAETGEVNLLGSITGSANAVADLGHPTKMTTPTNSVTISSSTIFGNTSSVPFKSFFSAGDVLKITGADNVTISSSSVDALNRIIEIDYLSTTGSTSFINQTGNFGPTSASNQEPVLQKLIKGVFFAADDTVRVADGALSTGTRRKQRGYIKQTHFKDAGVAKDEYDNWFSNDCDLSPPTDIAIHASSYPSAGAGFHLNIDTPATDSSIVGQFAAKTYQIAGSFIYKGDQESLLYVPSSAHEFTTASGDYIDVDVNASPAYDERITGARIYIKPSGTNEPWSLLLDIDLRDGCRTGLDDVHKPWAVGGGASEAGCDNLVLTSENLETYTILNGFSPSEFSITLSENGENYKDAVIANRRVFICNVQMIDENAPSFTDSTCDYNNDPTVTMDSTANIKVGMSVSGTGIPAGATVIEVTSATTFELSASTTGGSVTNGTLTFSNIVKRMRDRIMFTPPNKFETFPRSFFIDVVRGDSDEYVALATYGDRLFAYKRDTLYIINVGSPSPSNWFLESTERKKGIYSKASLYYNDDGIFWANQYGAFIFDGSRITNLLTGKLDINNWELMYRPNVVYYPINRSLYVFPNYICNAVEEVNTSPELSMKNAYVYSFDSKAWSRTSFGDLSAYRDNVHSNYIVRGDDTSSRPVVKKQSAKTSLSSVASRSFASDYTPSNRAAGKIVIVTKDIDFGEPGRIKKVYSVRVTYKSSAIQTQPILFATNGGSSFTALTGNFASTSAFDVLVATPSSPIECQSLQLKITNASAAGTIEINDISIEYRNIYKRVT